MAFNSVSFLFVFLPIILIVYYSVPKYLKNIIILIGSLCFYSWGKPVYLILIILSICVTYIQGLMIRKYNKLNIKKKSRNTLIAGIIINCTLLIVFKYLDLPDPLGISIFTFQIMSYLIDVYRKDSVAQENPLDLALYIAMFPQLIAGPILKYQTIENQINYRDESIEKFALGVRRFVIGLAKKVIFANTIGSVFNELSTLQDYENSVALSWICGIAFMMYIYFNFSGYADMAIGIAKMFSFEFPENFNYPYVSRSITEFWQRWNISMVTWFRDYVYVPLGGNRGKKFKIVFSTLIVWLLIGLWYGLSWNFIVWGLFNAVILILEKLFIGKFLDKIPKFIGKIYTLLLINISWVIFAYDNMGQTINTFKNMFFANGLPIWNQLTTYYLISYGVIFIILIIAASPFVSVFVTSFMRTLSKSNKSFDTLRCVIEPVFYLLVLIIALSFLVSNTNNIGIIFN